MRTILIPASIAEPVVVEAITCSSYQALCAAVGGDIEAVTVYNFPGAGESAHTLYLNELGKLVGLPINLRASRLMRGSIARSDFVVGDAVLAGLLDAKGEHLDVTDAAIGRLQQIVEP